ncbi:endolytic transglycosylase MltG [Williamsia sp. SKLECPSW1]
MSDENRHRRRAGDDSSPERLFRLPTDPDHHPRPHRRARADDQPPPDPRTTGPVGPGNARRSAVDPTSAGWTEPRRARPRAIPPRGPAGPTGAGRDPGWERPLRRPPSPPPPPPPAPPRDPRVEDTRTPTWGAPDDTGPVDDGFSDVDAATVPTPALTRDAEDRDTGEGRTRRPSSGRRARRRGTTATVRRRRRVALAGVLVVMVVLVCGLGYAGLRLTGFFVDDDDFSGATGNGDVLVQIPNNASLTKFGQILTDQGVVASVRAFTDAAGDKPISAGFYKLRTHISAASAVSMLDGDDNRVGRVVIPAGRQLDTKQSADGSATTGIFAMVAQATTVTIDGTRRGVTAEQLAQAAATATPEQLGVPSWATARVQQMTGDHRRIEGLIAPVAWEAIDPSLSPVDMLRYLISTSAGYFERWGLTRTGTNGLDPYDTLVAASVVEKEVADPDDYGKVARVIVNRLAKNQKLEMDSTANYTAAVVNIDVSGDAYTADTKWNTYRVTGLPATPIGSVGENVIPPTVDPPAGNWLYFVAVDAQGTTVFTDDYQQHLRNRQRACDNKVLSVGCR